MKKLFAFLTINLLLGVIANAQPYKDAPATTNFKSYLENMKTANPFAIKNIDTKLDTARMQAEANKKQSVQRISVTSVYNSHSYQTMDDLAYTQAVINNYSELLSGVDKTIDKLQAKADAWTTQDEQGKKKIITEKCDLHRELLALEHLTHKIYIPMWSIHPETRNADKKVRKAITKSIGEKGLAYMIVLNKAIKAGDLKAYYKISPGFFKHFYPDSYK